MLQPKTYIQYNYSRIRNVWIFLFFFGFLKSVWGRTGHQNRWKWHFYCFVLLFLMIHGSSWRILQFIAASFGVWGYRNRFLRSIMNVVQHSWTTQVKKKIWNHLWNSLWGSNQILTFTELRLRPSTRARAGQKQGKSSKFEFSYRVLRGFFLALPYVNLTTGFLLGYISAIRDKPTP